MFDEESFMQNEDVHNIVHPMVQRRKKDWRNPFTELPDSFRDNGVISEIEKDDQVVVDKIDEEEKAIRNWVDDYERHGNYGEEMKYLDDDIQGIEKELGDDFDDEVNAYQIYKRSDTLWKAFMGFRWILNMITIGIPWTFVSQIFFAWNVLFNAKWNFLWAGGNVYLIANTVYAYVQTWMSVFLIYEIPFYMRHFKLFRFLSLCSAVVYNFLYFASVADFLILLFKQDKDTIDIFYLMSAMFFGYNIVLHFPITIVNFVIFVKEIFMEMFQASSTRHGHNVDLALGLYDVVKFWTTLLGVANPMNYLRFVRKELYEKLYKKTFMKPTPNQPQRRKY